MLFQCTMLQLFPWSQEFRVGTKNNAFDINTRTVYTNEEDDDAGLEHFTSLMNLSKPVTSNNFDKIVDRLVVVTKEIAEETMQEAATELKTDANVAYVAVSCDGSWQRRGYSSLNDASFLWKPAKNRHWTDESGLQIMWTQKNFRFDNRDQNDKWKAAHTCRMNYTGSAGNTNW